MQTPCWEQGAATDKGDQEHALSNLPQPRDQAKCKRCQRSFKRDRLGQKYCCARCRNAAVKARLRARSGDLKPSRRHLLLPQRDAVTFGQKKRAKTKAIFDPLTVNFRRPVIDFLQRGDDLLRLFIHAECWNYSPLSGDDVHIEIDADGHPTMPAFLKRGVL